jgi:hypothetical protein
VLEARPSIRDSTQDENWGRTIWEETVEPLGANLSQAYLGGAVLIDAYLEGAFLAEAHLERAYLTHAHTDSAFTDHTTYWQNLEQVVGPIAMELVRGQPALERMVQAHLATGDHVLLRRAQVAWRSSVALAVGFGLGLALFLWDGSQGWQRIGRTLATSFLKFVTDLVPGGSRLLSPRQA